MAQEDVPRSRNGKHKEIVARILSDLRQTAKGSALKVPLAQLAETKEKVRSALNRASRKSNRSWRRPATNNSCTCGRRRRSRSGGMRVQRLPIGARRSIGRRSVTSGNDGAEATRCSYQA